MTRRTLRQIVIVCRKELKDSLRDRRAVLSVVLGVLLGPILVGVMLNLVADRQREAEDVRIPVVGAANAPALVAWLAQHAGVEVAVGPADAEQAVRDQEEVVVVVIPEDFAEHFDDSLPAPIRVVSDSSRNDTEPTVDRVRRLLRQSSSEIASLRLIVRGVSPVAMTTLAIEDIEISTAQERAARLLTFIPMFILLAAFVGGMQIATDSTAGERERGSLESLLVNPAPRVAFASGKWLAAALAAAASVVFTTVLCAQLTRFLPLADMGIRLRFGPEQFVNILLAAVPMCLLSAALQTTVASLARSFKEAQTYMGMLVLLPMMPGLVCVLYPLGSAAWMYAVPMLGPYVLLTSVLGGQTPDYTAFLASAGTSMLGAAILIRITTGLFRSEHVILAR
jgi:sodium transport system permease protein